MKEPVQNRKSAKLSLLSTDFDGTLLPKPWEEKGVISSEFFERLAAKREKESLCWVVNTGRNWPFLKQELEALQAPIWPDWVITVEREIWQIQDKEAIAWGNWNQECDALHAKTFAAAGELWPQVEAFLRAETRATLVSDKRSPLVIRGEDEKEIERVARFVEPLLAPWVDIALVRNSIYLNFSHVGYNKGTCLVALAGHLQVPTSEIFAIGDHFNDLPMLHRDRAAHVGCPGNSVEEVKAHVRAQEGYVAKAHATEGVLEAWDYFFGH